MDDLSAIIGKYGFPIVACFSLGGLIYYIWSWVVNQVKPDLSQANADLIALIDRIRMLDNDLIRLDQKVSVTLQLRGKTIERERILADFTINNTNSIDS